LREAPNRLQESGLRPQDVDGGVAMALRLRPVEEVFIQRRRQLARMRQRHEHAIQRRMMGGIAAGLIGVHNARGVGDDDHDWMQRPEIYAAPKVLDGAPRAEVEGFRLPILWPCCRANADVARGSQRHAGSQDDARDTDQIDITLEVNNGRSSHGDREGFHC